MGGEMGDANPGKNEEASVHGYFVKVGDSLFFCPAEMPVSASYMSGRAAPPYAGYGSALRESDVFEVFPDGLPPAQVMMFVKKAPVQFFQRSAADHEDGQGQEFSEGGFQRRIVDLDPDNAFLTPGKPCGDPLLRRKGDMAFGVKLQKKTPAQHVSGGPVGLGPVPETAEFLRNKEPALIRMLAYQTANFFYLSFAVVYSAMPKERAHPSLIPRREYERKHFCRGAPVTDGLHRSFLSFYFTRIPPKRESLTGTRVSLPSEYDECQSCQRRGDYRDHRQWHS